MDGGTITWRPLASKRKVRGSPSSPSRGRVLPLSMNTRPPALPAWTTISCVARTDMPAGAIKVSRATGLPSAVMATHEVCSARITNVKGFGAFTRAAEGLAAVVGG